MNGWEQNDRAAAIAAQAWVNDGAKQERERIIALLKESMCDAYGEDCTDNPGCSAQERIFALIKGENK